jgi:hypothetical protein
VPATESQKGKKYISFVLAWDTVAVWPDELVKNHSKCSPVRILPKLMHNHNCGKV